VRVIAGTARGCKLEAPEGLFTRPTADRIKETLFNIIAADLPGCVFLDVFSGTGAIAAEALSRGAGEVLLIENDAAAAKMIARNLAHCSVSERARLITKDYTEALASLQAAYNNKFDFIFMDPPYHKNFTARALELVAPLLADGGKIIAEVGAKEEAPIVPGLTLYREKKFAAATLLFYRKEEIL